MTDSIYSPHSVSPAGEVAFDPKGRGAERYDGVRRRRIVAFLVDGAIVVSLVLAIYGLIFVLGLPTFGLTWLLFPVIGPAVPILYDALTLGGPHSATPGMRLAGLQMRTWDRGRMYPLLALVHGMMFWFTVTLLTPLVLFATLFSPRKRLLHDILLGTIVIRRD